MTPLQALTLGIVQGLTEFLPISSSGHLVLVPVVLGWPDQGLAFDAAVHLGTALALAVFFGREIWRLRPSVAEGRPDPRRGLLAAILVGTLPAAVAGLALGPTIELHTRSARVVALSLIGWGLVLWWADRQAVRARVRTVGGVGLRRAVLIGLAQAIALVPGTSRSGITIAAGLASGVDRPTAARFSFLLGLPATAGAGALKAASLMGSGIGTGEAVAIALALGASFLSGLAAVWFLLRYLQRRSLVVFVAYRIVLGLLILWAFR